MAAIQMTARAHSLPRRLWIMSRSLKVTAKTMVPAGTAKRPTWISLVAATSATTCTKT